MKAAPPLVPRRRVPAAAVLIVVGAAGFYGALALDTAARSREAYREAERYTRWFLEPDTKKKDLTEDFRKDQERLARDREAGRLTEDAYRLGLDLLRVRTEMAMSESSAQRASQWYRDVYTLYCPPETPWTRRARLLAPAFREAWREEVESKRLPATGTYWDPEPGVAAEERVVFSARKRGEAADAVRLLLAQGIGARMVADPRPRGAGEGHWVAVAARDFWNAHRILRESLRFAVPAILLNYS